MSHLTVNPAVRFQGRWKVDTAVIKYNDQNSVKQGVQEYRDISSIFKDRFSALIEALPDSVELEYDKYRWSPNIRIQMKAGVANGDRYSESMEPKKGGLFKKPESVEDFIQRAVNRAAELAKELKAQ